MTRPGVSLPRKNRLVLHAADFCLPLDLLWWPVLGDASPTSRRLYTDAVIACVPQSAEAATGTRFEVRHSSAANSSGRSEDVRNEHRTGRAPHSPRSTAGITSGSPAVPGSADGHAARRPPGDRSGSRRATIQPGLAIGRARAYQTGARGGLAPRTVGCSVPDAQRQIDRTLTAQDPPNDAGGVPRARSRRWFGEADARGSRPGTPARSRARPSRPENGGTLANAASGGRKPQTPALWNRPAEPEIVPRPDRPG